MKGGYMSVPRRNMLFALNMIFPLICGLIIYVTKAENSYVSDVFCGLRSTIKPIDYPPLIRNHACDFLWAYAMFFCFRLTLGDKLKGKHEVTVIAVTCTVAIILELIQLLDSIHGTFDPLDIAVELLAAFVALFITQILERRFKNEE